MIELQRMMGHLARMVPPDLQTVGYTNLVRPRANLVSGHQYVLQVQEIVRRTQDSVEVILDLCRYCYTHVDGHSLKNELEFISRCGLSLVTYMYTHEYAIAGMEPALDLFMFPWCTMPQLFCQFLCRQELSPNFVDKIAATIDRLFGTLTADVPREFVANIIAHVGQVYLVPFLSANGLPVALYPTELDRVVECPRWPLMPMPLDKRECSPQIKYHSEFTTTLVLCKRIVPILS